MKIIFFGAGYCSRFIIPKLPKNAEIICTHNENIKSENFDKSIKLVRLRLSEILKNQKDYLKGTTHILNSIPPNENGDVVIQHFKENLISIKRTLKWYGYFSSTSVYGDHFGKWVDEKSQLNPKTNRGKLRLKSENQHLELFKRYEIPIHIFRLPGIYGPGRSVFDKFLKGSYVKIKKEGHYFSRVFVEDIADAIIKSMKKITSGEIFNLTDDMPTESEKVVSFAAKLLGIEKIRTINFDNEKLDSKIKSFYNDNKRVRNQKIKKILEWTPKFRNYKLGLQHLFESLNNEKSITDSSFFKKN